MRDWVKIFFNLKIAVLHKNLGLPIQHTDIVICSVEIFFLHKISMYNGTQPYINIYIYTIDFNDEAL